MPDKTDKHTLLKKLFIDTPEINRRREIMKAHEEAKQTTKEIRINSSPKTLAFDL
ncbi:MAG: hypothetical protein KDJ35_01015 [Alphaproteobacteria bacterium]|nr:hypothetical protein [Alphaproteobacteria bacterium]